MKTCGRQAIRIFGYTILFGMIGKIFFAHGWLSAGIQLLIRPSGFTFLLRTVLLVPIGWAALRYGWETSALASALASLVLGASSDKNYDLLMMQTEVFVGLAISLCLLLIKRRQPADAGRWRLNRPPADRHVQAVLRERRSGSHIASTPRAGRKAQSL